MKKRVEEMEKEAEKLRQLQAAAESASAGDESGAGTPMDAEDDKSLADQRSIYVGNVSHIECQSRLVDFWANCDM